ncbi:tetratricopeptide repeat protein [Entomospira entomophila]|uniref:Tetratricopeptide repeat protein n=1 Tax=Entomospira entomophila TaxID=2719988 RepID=A0A968KR25_9SPIO|nr:tetratricopeptide repeat protein [Entomospira entomophilus]NIZ40303.1 tetratricopeptide repeat protein [Entomospira entomophilus]WDI35862.1 tetratricopeptide repeat protein [Entomospira entomophilus]
MRRWLWCFCLGSILGVWPIHAQSTRLDQLIADHPEEAEYYFLRGREFLLREGNFPAAIADFSSAIERDSWHFEAYLFRAIAYFESGEKDIAKQDALKARLIKEEDARLNAILGIIFMHERDYYRAADFFTRQIQLDPENSQAYANRAWALLMLPSYSEMALRDYEEALKKNPHNVSVFYNQTEPLIFLERYEEAEESLSQAIHLQPSNSRFYFKRALIRLRMKDYERALADNLQVLRLMDQDEIPMIIATLVNITDIYLRLEKWDLVIHYSDLALELSLNESYPAYVNRGLALVGLWSSSPDLDERSREELENEIVRMFDLALQKGFPSAIYLERRIPDAIKNRHQVDDSSF